MNVPRSTTHSARYFQSPHPVTKRGWWKSNKHLNTAYPNGLTTKSAVIVIVLGAVIVLILVFGFIYLRCSRRRRRHQGFHQGKARRHTPNFELQPAKKGFNKRPSPAAYDGAGSDLQTALDRQSVEAFRRAVDSTAASGRKSTALPNHVDDNETTAMPAGSTTTRRLTALQKGKGRMYPHPTSDHPPGFDGTSDAQLVEELNDAVAAAAALKQATLNDIGLNPSDQDLSAVDSAAPQGQLQHLASANNTTTRGARHFSFTTKAKDERLDLVAPAPPPMTASERQRLSSGYEAEDERLDTATSGDGSGSISTGSRMSSTSSVSRRGWRHHADEELHAPPPGSVSQISLRGGGGGGAGQVAPRAEITPMGKFGQTGGPKWQSGGCVSSSTADLSQVVRQPVHGGMPGRKLRNKKGSVGAMARPALFLDGAAGSAGRQEDEDPKGGELSVPRKRPFSQRGSREGDSIDDAGEARGKWVEDEFGDHYWVEDEIAMRRRKRSRDEMRSGDSGYLTGQGGVDEDEGEGEGEWEDAREEAFTLDDLPSAQFNVGSRRGKGV